MLLTFENEHRYIWWSHITSYAYSHFIRSSSWFNSATSSQEVTSQQKTICLLIHTVNFLYRYGVGFFTYWLSMLLCVTTPGCSVKGFISTHYWYWHLQMRKDCSSYVMLLHGVRIHHIAVRKAWRYTTGDQKP